MTFWCGCEQFAVVVEPFERMRAMSFHSAEIRGGNARRESYAVDVERG